MYSFLNIVYNINTIRQICFAFAGAIVLIGSCVINGYGQSFSDLLSKGETYYETAFYDEARDFSDKALKKAEDEYSKESIQYAAALELRGRVYMIFGDYEQAEKIYLQTIKILESKNAEGVTVYGAVYLDLAMLYSYMDDFQRAEKTFEKSNEVNRKISGDKSREYTESLYRNAAMYFDYYKYDEAEEMYRKALEAANMMKDRDYGLYTQILSEMGIMYEEQKKPEKIIPLLTELLRTAESTKGKEHPDYRFYLIWTARTLYGMNKNEEAKPLILELISEDTDGIINSFHYLSESDKLVIMDYYLQDADLYYSFALEKFKDNGEALNSIADYRLMTKNLVLFSTNGIRKRIFSTEDPSVKALYEELIKTKTLLSKSYTKTKEELEKEGINLKELESKAKETEGSLSTLSEYFKTDRESYETNWKDVRNSLHDDETAVDFLDFVDAKNNGEDTIYCAFIIRKEYDFPRLIKLCSKKELDIVMLRNNPEDIYIRDTEAGKKLYSLIWKPLEEFTGNSATIYISPSGLLNKVSFHALTPDGNNYLINKYNIIYKGNLKEIIDEGKERNNGQGSGAVIFGGILYDVEPSIMSENASRLRNYNPEDFDNKQGLSETTNIERGGGWKYLKGTITESDNIAEILNSNGFTATLRKGAEGNEEAFKSLSGKNSPAIIHLATHGFFFPGMHKEKTSKDETKITGQTAEAFRTGQDPMLRSGVVLAGANNIWSNGKNMEGMEDGVLTAYEVSDMNLTGTELVVLSACESGLGDFKGCEGVFGLQRAFRIAGAKNIIVSLWKVPDKETAELMELFYTNLAEKKMGIKESFNKAQKEMRDKYPEPYYWAAFILI